MSRIDRWRLLDGSSTPAAGPTNMAVDTALLDGVKAGDAPVLRLYRWAPATLSFGRNQPSRGRYDREAAKARGIDFVRRPTGGQAVLHDDELTYAVVAPVPVIGKPRAAYRTINRALVEGLKRLGARATLAGDDRGPAPQSSSGGPDWDAACFRRPERGEVVVGGAKLVGSAQRMEGRTILQHGSILVGGSQAAAEALLLDPRSRGADADPGWTTLERELGERPALAELVAAIRAGFEAVLGVGLEAGRLTPGEAEAVASLEHRYRSTEWTWRR